MSTLRRTVQDPKNAVGHKIHHSFGWRLNMATETEEPVAQGVVGLTATSNLVVIQPWSRNIHGSKASFWTACWVTIASDTRLTARVSKASALRLFLFHSFAVSLGGSLFVLQMLDVGQKKSAQLIIRLIHVKPEWVPRQWPGENLWTSERRIEVGLQAHGQETASTQLWADSRQTSKRKKCTHGMFKKKHGMNFLSWRCTELIPTAVHFWSWSNLPDPWMTFVQPKSEYQNCLFKSSVFKYCIYSLFAWLPYILVFLQLKYTIILYMKKDEKRGRKGLHSHFQGILKP